MTEQIRAAQMKAEMNNALRPSQRAQAVVEEQSKDCPRRMVDMPTPDHFLGTWSDSNGNLVTVCATDAFSGQLVAAISRPRKADIHLSLWQTHPGGAWACGDAKLVSMSPEDAKERQVFWCFPDGSISVWARARDEETQLASSPSTKKESGEDRPSSNSYQLHDTIYSGDSNQLPMEPLSNIEESSLEWGAAHDGQNFVYVPMVRRTMFIPMPGAYLIQQPMAVQGVSPDMMQQLVY